MFDLQQLHTFRILASTGSFTRTAELLGYSQSAISAQIKALERSLGTDLFVRSRFSRTIALTHEGTVTLEYAVRILALASEARSAIGAPELIATA